MKGKNCNNTSKNLNLKWGICSDVIQVLFQKEPFSDHFLKELFFLCVKNIYIIKRTFLNYKEFNFNFFNRNVQICYRQKNDDYYYLK